MFKKILPILIATLLSANTISTNPKILSLDAPFEVESNLSIFETDSTGYTHQDLLKCTPSIEAAYRILSPTKLRVIPRRDLQSDTIYSCSYNQRAIELYTQPFMLLDYHFFTKERIIRLQFNDKVDLKSIKSAITLQKKERLSRTDLHYSITQHNEQTLLLKIDEPIGHHGIVLRINEQLQTTHQSHLKSPLVIPFDPRGDTPVTLNKEKEPMIIHDRPQMVSLPSGEFAIRIFLDDTLEGRSERFISIDGITNFRLNKNNYITYEERREHNLSDESYYYTDIISSEFKPNSTYHLTLHKGLHHYQELKEDQSFTFKTKDRAKTITFQADKPYISSNGELAFSSVNINQATLIVERILEQNLRYFVNFSSAQKRDISRYIKEVTSKEIILNNPKNIITKQKFKLSQLAKPLPFGIYRITLRYRDGDREKSSSTTLFLSNLGISANLAKDQAIITILSLDTATPTPNAKVELYGKNNQLIGTATTDQDGVAIIEKRDLLLENPKGVIVSYKGDKNFLALNHTIHSPHPEEILQKMERFKAHIYFQSRLVRPQGEVHALITIKDRDFISASKIPVEIELEELYGESITKKIYHTDKFGLIDFSYQFDKEDQTGSYRLIVRMGENILGERTFKLESFLPPKIENHITLNQESYTIGESIEVNLSTNYLFGADAAGLQGDIKLITQPVAFHAKAFQGYTFDNPYLKAENTQNYLHYHESIQLDNRGKTNIIIPTHTHQKIPSILQAMIGVTIMDDTQPVATYHPLTLYPYPEMVGIKLKQKSLQKDQKLQGRVILIDPKSQKPINRDLYATIKRVEWHYSYTDDNYVWERELIDIDSFTIPANEPFVYPIDGYGEFILEIKDILGGHSAATNFDLWGDHYSNLSPKDNLNSLEIKIDEHLYQQGENLVATIKSPILEGELYVMLESDKLISHKHYRITKGVAKIELPINQPIPHGAYLHAVVYRPSDSSNRLIPFRAIGYHYIKPNRNEHKIDIQLNTPPKIHANSTIKLGIKTDKPAKVLISIVDKGILQLASQKDPKLFDYFNEQPNRVFAYYDLYDQLLAYLVEGRLIDFGAGDIDGINRKKKHLPPDLGKRIKPFMIWSGVIENPQKSRELTINIPEFNGKATIVAIAINEDSLGLLTEDITIKDDIMIKPSYPLYLLSKDSVNLPIRLFNTTNEPQKVHLLAKSSENLTIGLKHPDIQLNPHSSKLITAQLKANKEGKGEIELRAIFGQKEVSSHIELPIYNPYALSTKTYKGIGANPITIPIPKAYQGAKAIITLSDNLIGSMREDLKYLVGYPYGCAEQTSSQIAAMHYAKIFFKEDRLIKESQNFIRQGVKKLRNMQNYYGEFEYWRYGGYINPYASLYAAQTLLELQRDGMDVDKRLIDKSIAMLKSVTTANGNYQATYSDFHRLYAAYILSEAKMLDTSMLNMLQEKAFYKKHFLSSYYMAAILKMSGKTTQAQQLYSSVGYHLQDYPKRAYRDHSGNFESNIRDMLLHFIIKTKYFHKDPKDLATIQRHLNELYSTQERAIALKAVSLYLGKPKRAKLHATLNINNQKREYHKPTTLTIDKLQGDTLLITPQSGAISYSIELIKHLPKEPKNQLSNKQPLSIMRQFVDDSNQPISINNLHQGEKIYSKITIANMQRIDNVVINQRIPACLSIVNHRIQNELTNQQFANQNINQQHQEILDDRVINILNLPLKKSTNPHQSIQNRGILYTPLIVTTKGECQLPAVITEAMYDSRIQDYAKEEMPLMIK